MVRAWLQQKRVLLLGVAALLLAALAVWAFGFVVGLVARGWWALAFLGAALLLALVARVAARWVPRHTWLSLDFERGVVEKAPGGLPAALGRRTLVLADVLDALERAGDDPRVEGLIARVGTFRPGLAVAQELRDAVHAFRAKGKRAVAWAETLGEGAPATVEVYLAAAFERVVVHPVGEVGFIGVLARHPFLRGAFDKLGVKPQLDHRREYKTALYLFTERGFTETHRASVAALVDSQVDQIVKGVAADRGLEPARVRALFDEGPFHAEAAREAGLVDAVAYRDEIYAELEKDGKKHFLPLRRYLRRIRRPNQKGTLVAHVHAVGTIARGPGRPGTPLRSPVLGSDDVTAALRRATRSKKAKAILIRVDSPGGSAVASDAMWREVRRAREKGKKVVVSMGNVAASGGYYLAAGADRIVAQPGTLTGSIGVVSGKFVTRDAFAKVGIDFDALKVGEHADIHSPDHPYGEEAWRRMQDVLDRIYADFKQRVAEGRGLDADAVEAVAKGRVWTGRQAKEHGLVDALGGREKALALVRELLALPADAPLHLRDVTPKKGLLRRRREQGSETLATLATFERLASSEMLGPFLRTARVLGLDGPRGALRLPPIDLSTAAGDP